MGRPGPRAFRPGGRRRSSRAARAAGRTGTSSPACTVVGRVRLSARTSLRGRRSRCISDWKAERGRPVANPVGNCGRGPSDARIARRRRARVGANLGTRPGVSMPPIFTKETRPGSPTIAASARRICCSIYERVKVRSPGHCPPRETFRGSFEQARRALHDGLRKGTRAQAGEGCDLRGDLRYSSTRKRAAARSTMADPPSAAAFPDRPRCAYYDLLNSSGGSRATTASSQS